MEHVFNPEKAFQEIYRTLSKDGIAVTTFPIQKWQRVAIEFRATRVNNEIHHIREAQYHGNPVDETGSLVTVDYGYDIH